ncbi:hypothetical protein L0128_09335 [candidate division KSB1 bacterium]|nr:hypothetical protein [candidate division KSB1 bacterium]
MDTAQAQYQRKVSAEEVQEGFIFVLKDDLAFFPKPDIAFKLVLNDQEYDAHVEAYDCWCRGPRTPHVHYRISMRKFRDKFTISRGTNVTFTKVADKRYILTK